jgi:aryl-alcohol dehydrogenase-like predicted oxidoreductase
MLTGKYKRNTAPAAGTRFAAMQSLSNRFGNDANWNIVEQLEAFCAQKGRKLLDLAFSWLLAKPPVSSVIAGATKPEQVEQNVTAAGWALTLEEVAEVDRITAKK